MFINNKYSRQIILHLHTRTITVPSSLIIIRLVYFQELKNNLINTIKKETKRPQRPKEKTTNDIITYCIEF